MIKNSFCVFYEWYKRRYPKVIDPYEYAFFYIFLLMLFPTFAVIKLFANIFHIDIRISSTGLYAKIIVIIVSVVIWLIVKLIFGKGKYWKYISEYNEYREKKKKTIRLKVWLFLFVEIVAIWMVQLSGGIGWW